MSSVVGRPFAQRTGNFVVLGKYLSGGSLYSNCYIQLESDIAKWAAHNASMLTVVGNVYTSSVANYRGVVQDLWYGSYYNVPEYPIEPLPIGMELKDMGKDIFIGVPGEANLLHLRLVQLPGALDALGRGASSGYVVIEANANIFDGDAYPNVGVARL